MKENVSDRGFIVDGDGEVWIGMERDFRIVLGKGSEYRKMKTQLVWNGSEKDLSFAVEKITPLENCSSQVIPEHDAQALRVIKRGEPIVSQGSYPDQFVQIVDGRQVWVGPSYESSAVQAVENSETFMQPSDSSKKLGTPDKFPLVEDEAHAHHFIYEEPNGNESTGYCKHCGKQVSHRNWTDTSDFLTNADHRFAEMILEQ